MIIVFFCFIFSTSSISWLLHIYLVQYGHYFSRFSYFAVTVKPLNSGHLQVLKNLSVIERCPLLGGNLKNIVTFGTKNFARYSRHVRYFGCPLLGGSTVFHLLKGSWNKSAKYETLRKLLVTLHLEPCDN